MTTMNLSLPDALSTFVEHEVVARGYESGGEYIRALIRDEQARQTLRGLLLEGATSGPSEPADEAYFQHRRDRVRASRTAAE